MTCFYCNVELEGQECHVGADPETHSMIYICKACFPHYRKNVNPILQADSVEFVKKLMEIFK
jgi:hypothetical protein